MFSFDFPSNIVKFVAKVDELCFQHRRSIWRLRGDASSKIVFIQLQSVNKSIFEQQFFSIIAILHSGIDPVIYCLFLLNFFTLSILYTIPLIPTFQLLNKDRTCKQPIISQIFIRLFD